MCPKTRDRAGTERSSRILPRVRQVAGRVCPLIHLHFQRRGTAETVREHDDGRRNRGDRLDEVAAEWIIVCQVPQHVTRHGQDRSGERISTAFEWFGHIGPGRQTDQQSTGGRNDRTPSAPPRRSTTTWDSATRCRPSTNNGPARFRSTTRTAQIAVNPDVQQIDHLRGWQRPSPVDARGRRPGPIWLDVAQQHDAKGTQANWAFIPS